MKSVFFSTILAIAGAFVKADAFENVEPKISLKPITDHNPVNVMKYTADPGVMVYDDTVYVYGTNDGIIELMDENPEPNEYSLIHSINVMSSKDLVNWVDHGTIPVGQDIAKWAQNSWAPTAAHKTINGKEKFFLYFANSGNGIGVVSADSPTGPFVDPIGDYLISHNTTNCEDITWLFDPAVFVDDDGTGYIYFGGGVPGEYENEYDNYEQLKDNPQFERPKTLRAAKLGDDMISLASEPVLIDAPWPYEDSGIHKVDGVYYYTYCTNWNEKSPFGQARIGMMASKSPLGPFEFVDTIFNNPGDFFTIYGNNHHTVIPFHDKFYIFYHSEWLNYKAYGEARGYRTTHVNELPYVDGKFLNATGTLEGVKQLSAVDPYQPQPAALMAWEAGTATNGLGHTTITYQKGEWTGVSGVDFFDGANTIEIVAQSTKGATIRVLADSVEGEVLGDVVIPASNKMETVYVEIAEIEGLKNIFFLASDEVTVDTWEFGSTDDCSEEEVEETVCTSDDETFEVLENDVDSELEDEDDSCDDEE